MSNQARPALGFTKKQVPPLLAGGKEIWNGMSNHQAIFTAPNPTLSVLQTQIQALDTAQQNAATRGKGLAALRNQSAEVLYISLQLELVYVRSLCIASPEQALSIIQAAGMKVAGIATHPKPVLGAVLGSTPQSVILRANVTALVGKSVARSKRLFFNWSRTEDGGKTFLAMPSTPLARTTMTGLAPLIVHGFRVSVTTPSGTTPWTDMVTILVA